MERWLTEKALTVRMNVHTNCLLIKRQEMVEALRAGDLSTVKQMYRQDRQLMNQISVYDEEGAIIFPRYRNRDERRQKGMQGSRREVGQPSMQSMAAQPNVDNNRINSHDDNNKMSNDKSSFLNHILQPMMPNSATLADFDSRPELADVTVVLPDEQSVIIQLRPHLRFADVMALQRGNFPIRLLFILVFSVLVFIWLCHTMTQLIRRSTLPQPSLTIS